MPGISVIIPTYNRAQFLPQALDSVLEQTFQDLEIIVIDDCSTDHTPDVLRPYQSRIVYSRVPENRGVAYARNLGLQRAQGDYIAFLDSDDFWKSEKLQKQRDFLKKCPEYSLVATQCLVKVIDDNFQTLEYVLKEEVHYELSYENIFKRPFIMPSSLLVKKQCFQEIGLFDESLRVLEDIDMYLRMARYYKIGFINEPLTVYTRGHEKNRRDSLDVRINRLKISEKNYDPALISKRVYKRRMSSLHAHIGKHYIQRGDLTKGKRELGKALSIDHCNVRALRNYLLAIWKETFLTSKSHMRDDSDGSDHTHC
jgi:glycosyltransferase involved in cell wall biosynthesis